MPGYKWQREWEKMNLKKTGYSHIMKDLEFEPYFDNKGECEVENSEGESWREKHEETMLRGA